MKLKKVTAVCFSPTGNAKKITIAIAQTIASRAGIPFHEDDITLPYLRRGLREYSAGHLHTASHVDLLLCIIADMNIPAKAPHETSLF